MNIEEFPNWLVTEFDINYPSKTCDKCGQQKGFSAEHVYDRLIITCDECKYSYNMTPKTKEK